MAEQEEKEVGKDKKKKAKSGGWFKAFLGTLGGLLSGAVMMYVTPLVDKVVKPPRPTANFEAQEDGLTVHFHILSHDGEGRWDFGDASPVQEKVKPDQTLDHTYPRAGDYTVKLTWQNAIGDEDDRSIAIHVEASEAAAPSAAPVVTLEVTPVSAGSFAPATFKIIGKVLNAKQTILDCGDNRPLQIAVEHPESVEQLVLFHKPGKYAIKLIAVNGTLNEQKIETITVQKAPANSLTAQLTVTDAGTVLETKTYPAHFSATFPTNSTAATFAFESELKAWTGRTLADLTFKTTAGQEIHLGTQTAMSLDPQALGLTAVQNLRVQMAESKKSVLLTGELVADRKNKTAPLPSLMLPATLTMQKKTSVTQAIPVTTTINVPASGVFTSATLLLPPIPKDWVDCKRNLQLEILNNGVKVYEDSQLQHSVLLPLGNRKLTLNASESNEQVRLDLMDAPVSAGNLPPQ